MNGRKLIRGRVLSFKHEPESIHDQDCRNYFEDGAILVEDGLIASVGEYSDILSQANANEFEEVDHRPNLLMAGFIDMHIHFPQAQVIGSWGAQLLDWLNTYTFPEETKFSNQQHADRIATAFVDDLIRHGTTSAVAFCSVHPESVDAYFGEATARNMRLIGGKVMMDRNAPDGLLDDPQSSYDDTKRLIEKWHGKGRSEYAISPRFAITSTPEQMEMAKALVQEHPECYMQTHLSENHAEIEFTLELYPQARDYLDIYEHYGLLGSKSLFGHAIHLEPREREAMADTGSVAVFCPTSNLFLGSGLYNEAALKASGVRTAIATDVGGGTNYSMLKTLDEGYKVLQLQSQQMNPLKSFYWITRGNSDSLGLTDKIGTLDAGSEADIVVLDAKATPTMALRMETVEHLSEELFVLQTMGDDRAIVETYIAGEPSKSTLK